jgi:hypothetical protein
MTNKAIIVSACMGIALTLGTSAAFAQAPLSQNRIAQQVVIGGLRVDAAFVITANGGVQSYSCPGPQQYVTPDGGSRGWACFDPTTNVWLLSALPPQEQAPAPAPAPVVVREVVQQPVYYPAPIYSAPPPVVVYRTPARVVYPAPVVVAPVSSSAVIGASVISAAGRIAAAVIATSGHHHRYYEPVVVVRNRGHRH